MIIENFVNNKEWFQYLEQKLVNEPGALYLVCAEFTDGGKYEHTDFYGLKIAMGLNPTADKPLVIAGLMPKDAILCGKVGKESETLFRAVMSKKHTFFIQLPFYEKELIAFLTQLKEQNVVVDEVAFKLYQQGVLGQLEHSLKGRYQSITEEHVVDAIAKARKVNITGTDQEVVDQILNFRMTEKSLFADQYWPGIFCDIEDTLIKDGEINHEIFYLLRNAENSGMPITLWTGGNLEEIKQVLDGYRFTWKLLAKQDFSGAEVEIAIDDMEEENFKQRYNIKVRDYRKV